MPRSRAAAEIDPLSSMALSRSALPGPMAIALRNMMRIWGFGPPPARTRLPLVRFIFGITRPRHRMAASSADPALGCRVVARTRVDPTAAGRGLLFFPERRPGLQIIHYKLAGFEGGAAVRARDRDEHNLVG